jgi:hypothetical protein
MFPGARVTLEGAASVSRDCSILMCLNRFSVLLQQFFAQAISYPTYVILRQLLHYNLHFYSDSFELRSRFTTHKYLCRKYSFHLWIPEKNLRALFFK